VSFTVAFQVFEGIFQFDAVLLEKAIHLHASLISEQAAELGRGELAFAVSFKGDGFEGGTADILAGRSQSSGKLVGKIEGKLHGAIVTEAAVDYGPFRVNGI
jgi:hypothetical protein